MSKFIYKNLVSASGTNPSLYKDDTGIYILVNNQYEGSVWIDMHISYDDGETWLLENYFPVDKYRLYDAKMVTVGNNRYVFAHGLNSYGIDTIRYIKYELYQEDEEVYAWDDQWQDLFMEYLLPARITDLVVDKSQNYIHIVYDKAQANETYGVYYALYSLASHQIIENKAIQSMPAFNQHNTKILQINENTLAVCWEESNEYKKNQIKYAVIDALTSKISKIKVLSIKEKNDKYKNHYHHSITIDSHSNIHIAWLQTEDSYDTNKIQYLQISNNTPSEIVTVSELSENNKYPYIMCDENDNLYILYNYVSQGEGLALKTNNFKELNVRYLVKRYDSTQWTQISDLTENHWNILLGWCSDKNIYSVITEDEQLYFLRIDTNIAEVFAPVDDLKIDSITNSEIAFSWTKARNAESISLQRLDDDKYFDAIVIEPLSVNDTWTKAVALEHGIYKFRIMYVTSDNVTHVKYLDQTFNITEDEFKVSWEPINDIISQTLQYTRETWSNVANVPITSESFVYSIDKTVTRYRLRIVGGVAEGYSNEVKPLNIELLNNGVKLSWYALSNIKAIQVRESMDGVIWYNANTKENININSDYCAIRNLNNVIYYYQIAYLNQYNNTILSNVVTITNNLKLVDYTYNSVTLHWNDVIANEGKYFQYSLNDGVSWEEVLYPINNNLATIPNLQYNTTYKFKIYFPNRYTGQYSNVITVTTKKKPIDDLQIIEHHDTMVKLQFTIDEDYSDVNVIICNYNDEIETIKLSELEHNKNTIMVNDTFKCYQVDFELNDLKKGEYYNFSVEPLDSNRGDLSNIVKIWTEGDGVSNFEVTNVSQHDITVSFGDLDINDITLFYSLDSINYRSIAIDTPQTFTLLNLMQNTKYYLYLQCNRGENRGVSETITAVTAKGNFDAIHGDRLPTERCFIKTSNAFYVFDKGILYKITDKQEIIWDYGIDSNHIYASITVDKNDKLHLIYSYGKKVYYASDCGDNDIRIPILIADNIYANELMFPNIQVSYDNKVYIVYEENYGYYTDIVCMIYKDMEIIQSPIILLNDGSYNMCPKIILKNSHTDNIGVNGFFVTTIDSTGMLKIIDFKQDIDRYSDTYKETNINNLNFQLEDYLKGTYNEIMAESDNLDKIHLCYHSYNTQQSMTYAIMDDNEVSRIVFNNCQFMQIIPRNSLIAIILQDNKLYSSKFNISQNTFTDRKLLSDEEINNINIISDSENIHILSDKNGEFLIQTFKTADIDESNKYIDNNWIDNEFYIDDDDCELYLWTDGDINNYPLMYIKINNLTSDITPRSDSGEPIESSIIVTAFEKVEGEEYSYKITYNGREMIIDANNRLKYDWDSNVIINEKGA